jgi:hypothetical protein
MATFGLVSARHRLIAVSEAGRRITAGPDEPAVHALLEELGDQPGSELVVTDELLREHPALGAALSARLTLLIAPAEVATAAWLLARAPPRATRRRATVLAQLPSIAWFRRFLDRATPQSRQLRLL